jgi:DNA-binding transcriptional ArsR family regulator
VSALEGVLSALADPRRRDLLERLSIHGDATATTLAEELPITRQAVVQHLAVLDSAGLVEGRREGREHRFAVRTELLVETARWIDLLAERWESRLAAIKQIAESEAGGSSSDRD